ncbi:MAG: MFS transporter [Solirubrobacterales bacterium]|nr:MFS transporter [Solirubrobacterales bacterium]
MEAPVPAHTARRSLLLLTVCLAVFAINLDTTIVNVALPTLAARLHASTGILQWVVDGYSLAFASLVLAGGSLGDRYGRRPTLLVGLGGFALASVAAGFSTSAGELVACRFVMGTFAALIYPTTLSIITNAYPDRGERAQAIGLWGAVTGLGVATGPVTGGLLLAHLAWGSVFFALAPVAVIATLMTVRCIPESRSESPERLDRTGLAASSATICLLVHTIIEAPTSGWASAPTIAGFIATVLTAAAFVVIERRQTHPIIDLLLFRVPAFSAASASVTVAFFALFGFIFLVTQYMQLVRGWGTLSTGLRILPVAVAIGAGSALSPWLATHFGTRRVVVTGLLAFGAAFAWIAGSPQDQPYTQMALEMILMGVGLGLTTTPATESILSVLPAAKAGVGSAVNDATREAGGALGVAVVGSIFTSLYLHHLAGTAVAHLPAEAAAAARRSVGAALAVTSRRAGHVALTHDVTASFMHGFDLACLAAAGVCLLGAIAALKLPGATSPASEPVTPAPAPVAAPAPVG